MARMRKEYDPNKVKQRKRKPIIYIICEGKETEVLYFKHFRTRNCLVDIVPMASYYTAAEHLGRMPKGYYRRLIIFLRMETGFGACLIETIIPMYSLKLPLNMRVKTDIGLLIPILLSNIGICFTL